MVEKVYNVINYTLLQILNTLLILPLNVFSSTKIIYIYHKPIIIFSGVRSQYMHVNTYTKYIFLLDRETTTQNLFVEHTVKMTHSRLAQD